MNTNTPLVYCYVNLSYLTRLEKQGWVEARIFGAASLQGRALMFHCQLNNGSVYYRLPISAFSSTSNLEKLRYTYELQPWDCPSNNLEVITYDWLFNQRVQCLRLGSEMGRYICTFDWWGKGTTAEIAEEHKCLHLIRLDSGQYALQPNNYLLWHEKSNVEIDGSHVDLRSNLSYISVE